MNIAIYSRKSRFVEGSESIENQIEMCKEYIRRNYKNVDDILIYEDEGFSGKNIDRPQFKKLMHDTKNKMFDMLVCYRLDRISRNVADFSSIITELQDLNIDFVSIREQFDTSSPMGRAMLYISSVFAQLERETIAERVRDNMMEIAKTGKWLGGHEPFGYKLENKGKGSFLSIDKTCSKLIKNMFEKYIEYDSLNQLVKYTITQNVLTPKNKKPLTDSSLKRILINPCYVIADENFYNYAKNKGMIICNSLEDFKNNTNNYGIMSYNRTNQSNKKKIHKEEKEWIIAISQHKGVVKSDIWISVQNRLKENASKAPNSGKAVDALLGGILKCANCGSSMRVTTGYYKQKRCHHYYKCRNKAVSNCLLCNVKNANGYEVDKFILDYIKQIGSNNALIDSFFGNHKEELSVNEIIKEVNSLEDIIAKNKNAIEKLTEKLIEAENSVASKYIVQKIENLDSEIKESNKRITEIKSKKNDYDLRLVNKEIFQQTLHNAAKNIDNLPFESQKQIVRNIFKEVLWDGEELKAIPRMCF